MDILGYINQVANLVIAIAKIAIQLLELRKVIDNRKADEKNGSPARLPATDEPEKREEIL